MGRQQLPIAANGLGQIAPQMQCSSTPAQFLGYVYAANEKAALEAAAKEFKVAEVLRNRLVVRRND